MADDTSEMNGFVAANLRRNVAMLSIDYAMFGMGYSFVSLTTILPALAARLGASNLLIGVMTAVATAGWMLPPLLFANHTERLSLKLRFVLTYTIMERLPLLALALVTFFLAVPLPDLTMALVIILTATTTLAGGMITPAWMDLHGKIIPTRYLGRFFGTASTLSGVLGLCGALIAGYYLRSFPYPLNFALCFLTGFACVAASYFALASIAEPPVASEKPIVNLGSYLRQLPGLLRRNRNFLRFLITRAVASVGTMAAGFYTVFALLVLQVPEWQVATFSFLFLASTVVANLGFGYLADRSGHKLVLVIGGLATVAGNILAANSQSLIEVYAVFVFVGIAMASMNVSDLTISLDFAPVADRPTYIGLSTTALAPFALLAPLLGGLLADGIGYAGLFWVASIVSALGAGLLILFVRDPRHKLAEVRAPV